LYSVSLFLQRNADVSLGKDYLFKLKNVFQTAKKILVLVFFISKIATKEKKRDRIYKKNDEKKYISSRFWKMNLAKISAI